MKQGLKGTLLSGKRLIVEARQRVLLRLKSLLGNAVRCSLLLKANDVG